MGQPQLHWPSSAFVLTGSFLPFHNSPTTAYHLLLDVHLCRLCLRCLEIHSPCVFP